MYCWQRATDRPISILSYATDGEARLPPPHHNNIKWTHMHKKNTNRCQHGASRVLSEEDLLTQRDIHRSAKYLWSAGTDPRVYGDR